MPHPKLIIIGTIALDNISTPSGTVKDALGGSAVFASYAASFFTKPGIVSVVGKDMPKAHLKLLRERGIDLQGLQHVKNSFRWGGSYQGDMNEATTEFTEVAPLLQFKADLPEEYRDAAYVLLANIDPELQLKVIAQLRKPKFIALDTMNLWIDTRKEQLMKAIRQADALIINDGEARQLFNTSFIRHAAEKAMKLGLKYIIIKKGDNGCFMFSRNKAFATQGYPLRVLKDPTGCGDSFAGSIMGYLAMKGNTDENTIRKGIIYGSVIASYNAQDFSLNQLKRLNQRLIEKRYRIFLDMRHFGH